jgi:hypothetical protein
MGNTVSVRTRASDHNQDGRSRPSRRSFLLFTGVIGASAVATTAGCGIFDSGPDTPPAPDPLTGFLADTVALATAYDATLTSVPSLAARLTPIRDAHRLHAESLFTILSPAPSPLPSGQPVWAKVAPSGTAGAQPPTSTSPNVALDALREAEQKAQQSAAQTCATAPAGRATLLGEIAAARAGHLEALA